MKRPKQILLTIFILIILNLCTPLTSPTMVSLVKHELFPSVENIKCGNVESLLDLIQHNTRLYESYCLIPDQPRNISLVRPGQWLQPGYLRSCPANHPHYCWSYSSYQNQKWRQQSEADCWWRGRGCRPRWLQLAGCSGRARRCGCWSSWGGDWSHWGTVSTAACSSLGSVSPRDPGWQHGRKGRRPCCSDRDSASTW